MFNSIRKAAIIVSVLGASLLVLTISSGFCYASEIDNVIGKIKKFEKAIQYFQQKDYLNAGKLFREVSEDEAFPESIRTIASQEYERIKNRKFSYSAAITWSPLKPKRTYKTDVVYLDVNGTPLPFKVKVATPDHALITLNQTFNYALGLGGNNLPADQLSLTHSLALMNRKTIKNKLIANLDFIKNPIGYSFGYKKEFEIEERKTPLWSTDHFTVIHKSLTTHHQAKISYTQNLKAKKTAVLSNDDYLVAKLSNQIEIGQYIWNNGYSLNYFRNPEDVYSEWTTGVVIPVSTYLDLIQSDLSRRKNHKRQSLLPKRRDDYKLDISLLRSISVLDTDFTIKFKQTYNRSSVSIFSYKESSVEVSLAF